MSTPGSGFPGATTGTSPAYYGRFDNRDQPTLNMVSDYIADARVLLQDTIPPYRYDDPSLLTCLNIALLAASRVRPDLFVFNLRYGGQVPAFQNNDATYVDIEPQFRNGILAWLCSHACARDQEDYQDARVTSFAAIGNSVLLGAATPGMAGGSGPGGQR